MNILPVSREKYDALEKLFNEQKIAFDQLNEKINQTMIDYNAAIAKIEELQTAGIDPEKISQLTAEIEANNQIIADHAKTISQLEEQLAAITELQTTSQQIIDQIDAEILSVNHQSVTDAQSAPLKVKAIAAIALSRPNTVTTNTTHDPIIDQKEDGVKWDVINALPHNQNVK